MATITDDHLHSMKRIISADPALKAEFKSWGYSRSAWKALIQAIEDWHTNGFNTAPTESMRSAMENSIGSITVARAQDVWRIWGCWRCKDKP